MTDIPLETVRSYPSSVEFTRSCTASPRTSHKKLIDLKITPTKGFDDWASLKDQINIIAPLTPILQV